MKFKLSMPAALLALLCLPAVAQDTERLLSTKYWETADADAVAAELDAGGDVAVRDDEQGSTPLHYAAAWSRIPEAVSLLIDRGADVMARDEKGGTPLHYAAAFCWRPEVLELLIDRGADVTARA